MIQPWIHKPKTDSLFILLPSFLVTAIVILFHKQLTVIQENHPFYTWLILIVCIDVAHVYATLFKTYFVPEEFQKRKKLLITLPILCFVVGLLLFSLGSNIFWSVLAYIAVFHFVRQQYGFVRLYSRTEAKTKINRYSDALIIYSATLYPMLYWFLSSPRQFNWFTENDFFTYNSPLLVRFFTVLYVLIVAYYFIRTVYIYLTTRYFNIPKNALIVGTLLSWYLGIVYYNNDIVFTLLNVVSHGIPYIALVYFKTVALQPVNSTLGLFKSLTGLIIFVFILFAIAFAEEYLWEVFVWNENFSVGFNLLHWHFWLVPLLTVPQFTHYLLDGFIWKSRK